MNKVLLLIWQLLHPLNQLLYPASVDLLRIGRIIGLLIPELHQQSVLCDGPHIDPSTLVTLELYRLRLVHQRKLEQIDVQVLCLNMFVIFIQCCCSDAL